MPMTPYNHMNPYARDQYDTIKERCHPPLRRAIPPPGLYLVLTHGRADPNQDMDNWGEDGPVIGPLLWCHITYCSTIGLGFADGELGDDGPLYTEVIGLTNDLLYWDGMYYGDWELALIGGGS